MSNEIKKYSFFKPLEKICDIKGEYSYYSLSNLNISDIKVLGKYIYLSCRIKKAKKNSNNIQSTEPSILQIQHSKIISEFNSIYNKNIFDFKPILIDSISYLITLGTDFKEVSIGNDRTFLMIPCVKIFPTILNVNNDDESFSNLIRTINLMKYINHDEIYNKNDYIRNIEPITNINCFEVSDDGTFIGIGLEKGEIIFYGNYEEFKKKFGEKFYIKNNHYISSKSKDSDFMEENNIENGKSNNSDKSSSDSNSNNNDILRKINKKNKILNSDYEKSNVTLPKIEMLNPLQENDTKNIFAKFSLKIYKAYIKLQGGYIIFMILLIFIICSRYLNSYRTLFITTWSKSRKMIKQKKIPLEKQTKDNYNNFYIYLKLSLYSIILNFIIEFILTRMYIFSQRYLHENMINKFLRAPINLFHDLVPFGQIINRLTKDISVIQGIIKVNTIFIRTIFALFSSIYICLKFNKSFLFIAPLITIIDIFISTFYYSCAR